MFYLSLFLMEGKFHLFMSWQPEKMDSGHKDHLIPVQAGVFRSGDGEAEQRTLEGVVGPCLRLQGASQQSALKAISERVSGLVFLSEGAISGSQGEQISGSQNA